MADLGDLYQSLILDHSRSPRNYGEPPASPVPGEPPASPGPGEPPASPVPGEPATSHRVADGRNPMCGDTVRVWLRLDGDRVADVRFVGKGCAISQASASLMTTMVKGKTRVEAEQLFARFHDLVTGRPVDEASRAALGRLVALGGVSRFPARVKCASLGWHAMHAALNERATDAPTVSTE
ncbi:MAG: SUF system NifU family Fe-S cluster assembly protein [Gemmatimonadaceae bacterium]|nr:SUF system NifU family Fe-S cluster assembly protein [Gemmatimonadaceae bacterium]NUQ91586.1 SUF system NifU family Fe-S cluster assembly protein [Gemmatimonadaceae bacterium]NUR20809.1 SUF system NifU family Fe-S cluster assembly protein [Gemmatimonadaceae bacterium]NUS96668.1 SUF system NifU family Fe-S cluster assembly protein [Gemmatimonadaceae bacterium]